jgi:hypothetical protein
MTDVRVPIRNSAGSAKGAAAPTAATIDEEVIGEITDFAQELASAYGTAPEVPAPTLTPPPAPHPKAHPTKLNAQQRHRRAQQAAQARHAKEAQLKQRAQSGESFDWANAPLEEAEKFLAHLRVEAGNGALILQQRYAAPVKNVCVVCHSQIDPGREVMSKQRRDASTGLIKILYYCSQRCVARENLRNQGVQDYPR